MLPIPLERDADYGQSGLTGVPPQGLGIVG